MSQVSATLVACEIDLNIPMRVVLSGRLLMAVRCWGSMLQPLICTATSRAC